MQAENWKTIKELLREVLLLAPLKRREFLEAAATDGEVLAEVESLLAFESESADFMSLSLDNYSKDFVAEKEISLVGQQIGIYEIIEEISFGGMGAVYLARRTDGKFQQKVAVKMLKREYNTKNFRRRFELEKEIQSKLHHPNIAALLDAGRCADGVPYLVMEYIEGIPIDAFCRAESLDLKARLKLFNRVCEAVSYAHQNLIIHRDLKPSNILVTEKGEPKLLDFGISKLLNADELKENNSTTLTGAMTPEYASPEQIRGETVTTATDIYSLGVVLYKMLTDSLPLDLHGKTNGELLKAITEIEPVAPSRTDFSLFSSDKNAGQLNRLKSVLRGDLDNIILKSLRKEPARRYKTVEQFSADVWRHIDGLPVLARRATWAYRARKFFGRNRISVIAAGLIFLSLITGIAAAVRQTSIAREQANLAVESQKQSEIETAHAKQEEEKAKKITAYMTKVFSYANPSWYAEGAKFKGETKVIEVMDELSDKIDAEFAGQADIQAELHHKFAEIYVANSSGKRTEKYKIKALEHIRRALELRRQFYGERHELVAKDMVYLYWCGGVAENERAAYLMAAINMMRETNPNNLNLPYMLEAFTSRLMMPNIPETHEQYRNAVLPPTDENKYQIAERYLRESLPVLRLHYKKDNQVIFAAECKLAYTLAVQEKWTDFDEHFAVCKQGEEKLKDGYLSKGMRTNVELVEKTLAEKTGLK